MITKKEDLIGTIFNIADADGGAIIRLAAMFYDVCAKYNIRVMGGNGRDYFMKAVGEGLVNLCISLDDDIEGDLVVFGRASIEKGSTYGAYGKSMCNFKRIGEEDLILHLDSPQTKEVEWENGLPPVGVECEYAFIGSNYSKWFKCEILYAGDQCAFVKTKDSELIKRFGCEELSIEIETTKFRKLETPEEKEALDAIDREELEVAYDLYCDFRSENNLTVCSIENLHKESGFGFLMYLVRKAGYRVEK